MSVTSSRAATKCISEVPGFMKQWSTPCATSVRMSASAPFTGPPPPAGRTVTPASKMVLGVEDAVGVEGDFDAAHEVQLGRILEGGEVRPLELADPVLAGDGTAQRPPGSHDVADQPVTGVGIGLPDGQVDVAVTGVAAPDDQRAAGRGQLGHRLEVVGDGGSGHDNVDDVVRPTRLGRPEGSLAGRHELGTGLVGQDVDVEGTQGGDLLGQDLGVLLQPGEVVVLEDDDQVGERLRTHLVGDAQVDAGGSGDPGHRQKIDVLHQQRGDTPAHDAGDGLGDPAHGRERGQEGAVVLGSRMEPQDGLGDEGQGPLRADDQLREVVAAGRLHELPARDDHLPRAQHGLDAEDVVSGHAVLDRPHAAGVGGHVATQAGRLLPGEHRVDEALGAERLVQLGQGDPRLDDGHVVGQVDLEDPVHPLEGDDHASLDRDAGTGQPGPRPTGDERHALGDGRLHDGHHLLGRVRAHDGHREDVWGTERLVVGGVLVDGARPVDVAGTDDVGQRLDDQQMTFDDGPAAPTAGPDRIRCSFGNVELLSPICGTTLTRPPHPRPPARPSQAGLGFLGTTAGMPPAEADR